MMEGMKRKHLKTDEPEPNRKWEDERENRMVSATEVRGGTNDIDYAHFESQLRIDPHALDETVSNQPDWMHKASDRYALAVSRRDEAKDHFKTVEAELRLDLKEGAGDSRVTEKELDARVQVSPKRAVAFKRFIDAERAVNEWDGMVESFKQRHYMIREMVTLHMASYFGEDASKVKNSRLFAEVEHERIKASRQAQREHRVSRAGSRSSQ